MSLPSLPMIKPKEVILTDLDGGEHTYIISRLPAMDAREIISQYPVSAMPQIGDYKINVEMMQKMMRYVEVEKEGNKFRLATPELINNHCPDAILLIKLEIKMLDYNTNFFTGGRSLGFLQALKQKLPAILTSILTDSLVQFSQKVEQASKSSKKPTTSKKRS